MIFIKGFDMHFSDQEPMEENVDTIVNQLVKLMLKKPVDKRVSVLTKLEYELKVGDRLYRRESKRRHHRRDYFVDADGAINGRGFKGFIKNLSSSGMFIEVRENFKLGEEIIIAFSPPKSQNPVKMRGVIVRKTGNGFGVEFKSNIYDLV